jgi:superfamily II DNA/RNA helicase
VGAICDALISDTIEGIIPFLYDQLHTLAWDIPETFCSVFIPVCTVNCCATDTAPEQLRLAFFCVRREEKPAALLLLLGRLLPAAQQAIVFCATRQNVELLCALAAPAGIDALPVYGAMEQETRSANLARFRAAKTRVLIVTDVAARGLDIPMLDNVINYDFPDKPKLAVHRVGRVARQGRAGTALSLVAGR